MFDVLVFFFTVTVKDQHLWPPKLHSNASCVYSAMNAAINYCMFSVISFHFLHLFLSYWSFWGFSQPLCTSLCNLLHQWCLCFVVPHLRSHLWHRHYCHQVDCSGSSTALGKCFLTEILIFNKVLIYRLFAFLDTGQLQLSEVIMRARKYMEDLVGGEGNVLTHHKTIKDLETYYASAGMDQEEVQRFLKNVTSDTDG